MEQFNWISSMLIGFSICVPSLLLRPNKFDEDASEGPLDKDPQFIKYSSALGFEIAFITFSVISASLELIVREQVKYLEDNQFAHHNICIRPGL